MARRLSSCFPLVTRLPVCSFSRRKSNLADMMEAMQDPPVVVRSSHRYCTVISATGVEAIAIMLSLSYEAACLQLFKAQEQSGRYDGGHAGPACGCEKQSQVLHCHISYRCRGNCQHAFPQFRGCLSAAFQGARAIWQI